MRWSWKLTAQHYRFYPHENITHLTIGPGIDDFSTFKKLAITWFIIDLNSSAVFFEKFNNLIGPKFQFRDFRNFNDSGPWWRLRVSLSFFDQTLKTHYFLTDDARLNPIFLLNCLTSKVYDDSISGDSATTSGGNELIKIRTSNAIGFRHRSAEVS